MKNTIFNRFTKENFATILTEVKKQNKILLESIETTKTILQKYEGKTLTKRFLNEVNKNINGCILNCDNFGSYDFYLRKRSVNINNIAIYLDSECLVYTYVGKMSLENLDALKNRIQKLERTQIDALKNWDKYIKKLQKLDNIVKKEIQNINPLFCSSGDFGFFDSYVALSLICKKF